LEEGEEGYDLFRSHLSDLVISCLKVGTDKRKKQERKFKDKGSNRKPISSSKKARESDWNEKLKSKEKKKKQGEGNMKLKRRWARMARLRLKLKLH
jgi:hypothetical protein